MASQDRYPEILICYWVMFIAATVAVAFRSYVRLHVTRNWGWDDSTIIAAWACLVVNLGLTYVIGRYGVGKHVAEINATIHGGVGQLMRYYIYWICMNVICTLLTKISISLFILRLKNTWRLRWTLTSLMVIMILATIPMIVIVNISCIHLKKVWEPNVRGTCLPRSTVSIGGYIQSSFSIAVDLALTASPIVILWNVKISTKKKFQICGLMSLGLTATATNILRTAFAGKFTTPDFTYDQAPLTNVATVEMAIGVIAACTPACSAMFNKQRRKRQNNRQSSPTGNEDALKSIPSNTDSNPDTSKEISHKVHGHIWVGSDGSVSTVAA